MKHFLFFVFIVFLGKASYAQAACPGLPSITYSGKTYNTVQIGDQCWLKENLDIGTRISGAVAQTNNNIIEKYCYNNAPLYCATYGGLYLWDEVMQYTKIDGSKGICPSGWHIPKSTELQTLGAYVNGNGNLLKAIGQGSGNGSGTNATGFSFLLSGIRAGDGTFYALSFLANIWSSTESGSTNAHGFSLANDVSNIDYHQGRKDDGYNVRCIKDTGTVSTEEFKQKLVESEDIVLLQNYPNPFNPTTTISFTLTEDTFVSLGIYNQLGQKIAELVNDEKAAGTHTVEWNASNHVSGIYFYEMKKNSSKITKKLILMK